MTFGCALKSSGIWAGFNSLRILGTSTDVLKPDPSGNESNSLLGVFREFEVRIGTMLQQQHARTTFLTCSTFDFNKCTATMVTALPWHCCCVSVACQQAKHRLRVLYTLQCYKDLAQTTDAGVRQRAAEQSQVLRNETWALGYDLCNEPSDVSWDHNSMTDIGID